MKYAWVVIVLLISSPEALPADASFSGSSTARSTGLAISAIRLQSLTPQLSLYATVQEQFDEGHRATLELRLLLPDVIGKIPGQIELVGFVDQASGRLSGMAWSAGSNRRTLTGGGLGLNWFDTRRFVVKGTYARKLGNDELTFAPDTNRRVWVNAVKYF
jgi:hypothetical protein